MTSSKLCFLAQYIFSLADNGTDISKTHLNKAEQIVNVVFLFTSLEYRKLCLKWVDFQVKMASHYTAHIIFWGIEH